MKSHYNDNKHLTKNEMHFFITIKCEIVTSCFVIKGIYLIFFINGYFINSA